MTLYQKFLDLTGLVHISEADFNAALEPKTDAQKALHDFIKWSVGKTDANPDAASFRTAIGNSNKDHKADVTDTVLSSPTVPTSEPTNNTVHTETTSTSVTPVATHSDAETVSSSAPVAPESNVVTNSETTTGEPSTLVVNTDDML